MFKGVEGSEHCCDRQWLEQTTSGESFSGTIDPTGLERAAKAAREIDASPNARAALELVREQERTKQSDAEAKTG